MSRRGWITLGLFAALAGTGLAAWIQARRARAQVRFSTAQAARVDLRESVGANGEVQARTRVNVGTTVTGTIKLIHVRDGQWVKAGDLLVTLDQERYQQEFKRASEGLTMAQRDLDKAEAAWRRQEPQYLRFVRLFQEQVVSASQVQSARLDRDRAALDRERGRAAVNQARTEVALARDALTKTVIRAPIAGRVTSLRAEVGETAVAGQTNIAGAVLMVLSRMEEMLAEVRVGELEVVKLKPGQPAEVQLDALPGKILPGRVLEVASGTDRPAGLAPEGMEPQNYRVRVQILTGAAELAELRPGMSARVVILAQEVRDVLAVPLQAVQERDAPVGSLGLFTGAQPVVLVLRGGRVEERRLRLGVATRQWVQVLEGLDPGEEILTGPARALTTLVPGQPVRTAAAGPR